MIHYQIEGDTIQTLYLRLDPNCRSVYSESGNVIYMTPNIRLTKSTGKFGDMVKRALTGSSLSVNHFELDQGHYGELAFSTRFPSKIIPLQFNERVVSVQQHSFLCAEEGIHFEPQSGVKATGLFGGNEIIYNKLSGKGTAFISIEGDLITKDLEYEESLLIHPGHLAAYEQSVRVELQRQVRITNMFFNGEGVYFLKVSGPGKIMLHSLGIHSLAEAVSSHLPL